ncbi:MAG TPA: dTMP kinase [Microthrixaceae bacterium]|nr:dTMP kinase [Microthrixaceae bacterium]
MTPGEFIAFDGPDGCGKSTQAALLAEALGAVLTREPGGTAIGTILRSILLDTANTNLCSQAEMLLMQADRAQHIEEVVRPHVEAGRTVVSDRSIVSTLAYQGFGRGHSISDLLALGTQASGGLLPTIAIVLSTPVHLRAERLAAKDPDRFESAGAAFQHRVADGFDHLTQRQLPFPVVVVDGTGNPLQIHVRVQEALARHRVRIQRRRRRRPTTRTPKETTQP